MRLIRLKEAMHISGLSRSTIYAFMAQGDFPQSVSLGPRAIAFKLSEIEEWVTIKTEERTHNNKSKLKESLRSPATEADVINFINSKFNGSNISEAIAWLIGVFKH